LYFFASVRYAALASVYRPHHSTS